MDKYTMVIKSKSSSDKDVSTTIGYINPTAQPSSLKSLAQGLTALTKNTYVGANRVATTDVDTTPDRTSPSVTLYYCTSTTDLSTFVQIQSSVVEIPNSYINNNNNLYIIVGVVTKQFQALPLVTLPTNYGIRYGNVTWRMDSTMPRFDLAIAVPNNQPQSFDLTIRFSETEDFAAWSGSYTINIVDAQQEGE